MLLLPPPLLPLWSGRRRVNSFLRHRHCRRHRSCPLSLQPIRFASSRARLHRRSTLLQLPVPRPHCPPTASKRIFSAFSWRSVRLKMPKKLQLCRHREPQQQLVTLKRTQWLAPQTKSSRRRVGAPALLEQLISMPQAILSSALTRQTMIRIRARRTTPTTRHCRPTLAAFGRATRAKAAADCPPARVTGACDSDSCHAPRRPVHELQRTRLQQ